MNKTKEQIGEELARLVRTMFTTEDNVILVNQQEFEDVVQLAVLARQYLKLVEEES